MAQKARESRPNTSAKNTTEIVERDQLRTIRRRKESVNKHIKCLLRWAALTNLKDVIQDLPSETGFVDKTERHNSMFSEEADGTCGDPSWLGLAVVCSSRNGPVQFSEEVNLCGLISAHDICKMLM